MAGISQFFLPKKVGGPTQMGSIFIHLRKASGQYQLQCQSQSKRYRKTND